MNLPKNLRQEYGGGLKEFVVSDANGFEGIDDETQFFTSQERQSLVLHLLHTLKAGPNDLQNIPALNLIDGQGIISKCISAGIISQVRHYKKVLKKVQNRCNFFICYRVKMKRCWEILEDLFLRRSKISQDFTGSFYIPEDLFIVKEIHLVKEIYLFLLISTDKFMQIVKRFVQML